MKRADLPSQRMPEDHELVDRLRGGDDAAFVRLLDAWSEGMHRLALSYLGSSASADEVVQETWVAVVENLAAFEGRSSLKHWVYRILIDTVKRRAALERRMVSVGGPVEEGGPVFERSRFRGRQELFPGHWRDLPVPWPTPEGATGAAEMREVVAKAVRQLPPPQAAVVTLRDIEGYEAEVAAALLEVTVADHRVLLHRGRAAVRAALEGYLLGGETDGALGDAGPT